MPCRTFVTGTPTMMLCNAATWKPQSPYCYWHRVDRTALAAQKVEARWRAENVESDVEAMAFSGASLRQEYARCIDCQWLTPPWYLTGKKVRRCKGCAALKAGQSRVQRTYGLTPEAHDRLFRLQGGRCAICRCLPRTRDLAVDHDHATGAVRGLLCSRCNHDLLGGGHDALALLRRAVAYLEKPPAQRRFWPPEGVG